MIITAHGKVLWPAKSASKLIGALTVSEEDLSIKCVVGAGDYRFREAPSISN